uniref:FBA_2 domain-containing protein n=1 Tax=Globodera pallida TaxID=36090 RepID=A0A183BKI2_GLOPA
MINVCADVWLTIFAFFCPAEVGLKFALLSYGFNGLVATHFKTRKWASLAWLKIIDRSRMIKENIDADFNNYKMCGTFPIPKQPVPASLRGFNRIYILPNRCWNVFGQEIWPLLLPYISSFNICVGHHFSNLRHFISPTILRDCAHLRWVYASPSLDRLFPVLEHPADDGPEASPAQALFKWLHTARADGLPKVLNWLEMEHTRTASRAVEILKQEFLNASSTSGVSYIVYFECSSRKINPFVLENAQTREQLTLQHHLTAFSIKRSPIFGDKKQWDGWLLEAGYKRWACLNNMIIIEITDANIGPLSLPVNVKKCK